MRLNPDCIRDILLTVEESTDFSTRWTYSPQNEYKDLINYSANEIFYHIKQCENDGLLLGVKWYIVEECDVKDLSPAGHEFLSKIRQDTTWYKVKENFMIAGSATLRVLVDIASNVAVGLLRDKI